MKRYLMTVSLVCISTAVALAQGQELNYGGEMGQPQMLPLPQMQSLPVDGDAAIFYTSLQPHGTWMQVSPFGPVWRPYVAVKDPTWQPYSSGGHWVWSRNAWAWESEYEWGWAPFHYGRWVMSSGLGWLWIPGKEWAPAWVSWNQTSTQCGWAPIPPDRSSYVGVCSTPDSGVSMGFQFLLTPDRYVYAPQRCFNRDRNDYYDNRGDYRSNDRDRKPEHVIVERHQDRPTAQVVREQPAVVQKAPEPTRRTTIMQQVVTRSAPANNGSSRTAPQVSARPQAPAPQVSKGNSSGGNNNTGNSLADKRTTRLQDIISRSRK